MLCEKEILEGNILITKKFEIQPAEKGIKIPFDEIFERNDVEIFNFLPLSKRIQYNQTDLIADDYQVILGKDLKLYYKLLNLLYDIRIKDRNISQQQAEAKIMNFVIENPIITERITNHINDDYTLDLNSKSKNTNVNTELQITDETNKVFLKGTMLMRFITPLLCCYEGTFEEKVELNYYDVYSECFKMFSIVEDRDAIINKLSKLVESRIVRTKYSDRVIWKYIRQMGMDPAVVSINMTKNIINTVLLKTKNNTSIVSFLDVVIRKKIKFIFEYNYPLSFKSIKVNNSKELEDKEKIEIHHLRADSGRDKLNQLSINMEVKSILEEYSPSVKEIDELEREEMNSIKLFIMEQYYSEFKIKSQSPRVKAILLFGLIQKFSENNMYYMSLILRSYLDTTNKKSNSRKRILNKIIDSPKYEEAVGQYSSIQNLFESNNIFRSLIDIMNNTFILDGELLEIPSDEFILECSKFINII